MRSTGSLAKGRYFEQSFGLPAVKIHPGEYYVSTRPVVLVAVVGNCVALCLRDTHRGIGGAASFLVPATAELDGQAATRYAWAAMETLVEHLLNLGARREHLRAMLFGACTDAAAPPGTGDGWTTVGFTRDHLAREDIPLDRQDVFDIYPRKVYYFPATGKVLVRTLRASQSDSILQREARYRRRLAKLPQATEGGLFAPLAQGAEDRPSAATKMPMNQTSPCPPERDEGRNSH